MRLIASLVAVTLLTGCAASPPDASGSPDSRTGAAAPSPPAAKSSGDAAQVASNTTARKSSSRDPTEVVCRREAVPNTRLGSQKICMTREDWERRADAASDAWREQQKPSMPESGD